MQPGRRTERRLALLIALQVAALLAPVVLPFGFDHPSSLGLDSDDALLVAAFYVVVLVLGLMLAIRLRRWWLVSLELALPAALVALALTGTVGI
jgi:hypothetical protein